MKDPGLAEGEFLVALLRKGQARRRSFDLEQQRIGGVGEGSLHRFRG